MSYILPSVKDEQGVGAYMYLCTNCTENEIVVWYWIYCTENDILVWYWIYCTENEILVWYWIMLFLGSVLPAD